MVVRRKVATTVYIEPEQLKKLRTLHEHTNVPIAVYVREGIELVLAKHAFIHVGLFSPETPVE